MDNHIVLFLTACIDPQGMEFTVLQDANERLKQYQKALYWYLNNTKYPILFVENTNYNITPYFQKYVDNGRLEVLSFDGNNYDKSIGKGYGEALILEYGINNSKILKSDTIIVKITGRLICENINMLLKFHKKNTIYANYSCDERGCLNRDSRIFISPQKFLKYYFLPKKDKLNDKMHCYFEHLLFDCIEEWKLDKNNVKEFYILPALTGYSGSNGTKIGTTRMESLKHFIKVLLRCVGIYRF